MSFFCCNNRCNSTGFAIVTSLIIGIIAAFLQITGVITLAPVFSIVAFGIALAFLALALLIAPRVQTATACDCLCNIVAALLVGILGTVLTAVIILAVGFAATSIIGAIFVGLLAFFFSLIITTSAALVRCLLNCGD